MARVYFAEFYNSKTNEIFYKFGHTQSWDAQKRLDRITSEYPQFKARVLASIYHPDVNFCIEIEEEFKTRYPKNFYLVEKISGVTEIVKLSPKQVGDINKEFRARRDQMYENSPRSAA